MCDMTIKRELEKRLDGTYIRLFMRVQNLSRKDHPTLEKIYKDTPPISQTFRTRRDRLAGHCHSKGGNYIRRSAVETSPSQTRKTSLDLSRRTKRGQWHSIRRSWLCNNDGSKCMEGSCSRSPPKELRSNLCVLADSFEILPDDAIH